MGRVIQTRGFQSEKVVDGARKELAGGGRDL